VAATKLAAAMLIPMIAAMLSPDPPLPLAAEGDGEGEGVATMPVNMLAEELATGILEVGVMISAVRK